MKRSKSFFAAMSVMLLVNVIASAQKWDCGVEPETVTCTLDGDGTFTVSGEGAMIDYWIGETPWYASRNSITEVLVQTGVIGIGEYAFYRCDNLTSVTISNSVVTIGDGAFMDCSNLSSVTIPNGVSVIGEDVFGYCVKLESIMIPGSVTSIGANAFANCDAITSIDVAAGNNNYASEYGVLFNKDKTALIRYPAGRQGDYDIPTGVVRIESDAFSGAAGLTSVKIPNSVAEIKDRAFAGCAGMDSVNMGNNVTIIGHQAFSACRSLTSVTIPSSVIEIGNAAFNGCTRLVIVICQNLTPPASGSNMFGNIANNACLYVPEESIDLYRDAEWGDFNCFKADGEHLSVTAQNRDVTQNNLNSETAAVPITPLTATFTVGPNPVGRFSRGVDFYYRGQPIQTGVLTIYDATGNVVRRISITDNVTPWDLKDTSGKQVAAGTYLVKGAITDINGKNARISTLVGVR